MRARRRRTVAQTSHQMDNVVPMLLLLLLPARTGAEFMIVIMYTMFLFLRAIADTLAQ